MTNEECYRQQLLDEKWFSLRKQVLERDLYKCRNCNSGANLQVHHRQYHVCDTSSAWKAPWQYAEKLLITLCETCHTAGHQQYKVPVFETSFKQENQLANRVQ